jgi:hypothetical protein
MRVIEGPFIIGKHTIPKGKFVVVKNVSAGIELAGRLFDTEEEAEAWLAEPNREVLQDALEALQVILDAATGEIAVASGDLDEQLRAIAKTARAAIARAEGRD